jgi:hypothetical protein
MAWGRCELQHNWIQANPNLTEEEGTKKLTKYMKANCWYLEGSCFQCPFLEIREEKFEQKSNS